VVWLAGSELSVELTDKHIKASNGVRGQVGKPTQGCPFSNMGKT